MKKISFELTDNQHAVLELDHGDVDAFAKQYAAVRANNILKNMFDSSVKAAFADSNVKTISADRDAILADAIKARQKALADKIKVEKKVAAKKVADAKKAVVEDAKRAKEASDAAMAKEADAKKATD